MARINKDDPEPHPLEVFLFHSHPPIAERLAMAEEYRRAVSASWGWLGPASQGVALENLDQLFGMVSLREFLTVHPRQSPRHLAACSLLGVGSAGSGIARA